MKWQKKRNQKQNVKMILIEERDDKPRITTIMHVRERIGDDAMEQENWTKQWVRKATSKPLNMKKEPKYDLVMPMILEGPIVEVNMLGIVKSM